MGAYDDAPGLGEDHAAGEFREPDKVHICAWGKCGKEIDGKPVWRTAQFIKTGSRDRQKKPEWLPFCTLECAREARDKAALDEAGQRWADGVCDVAAALAGQDCWFRNGERMTRREALEWDRRKLSPEAFARRWPQEVGR